MKFAINDLLEKIHTQSYYPTIFNEIIIKHFNLKKDKILNDCVKWVDEASAKFKAKMHTEFDKMKSLLNKL